jgi:hypothetical protein
MHPAVYRHVLLLLAAALVLGAPVGMQPRGCERGWGSLADVNPDTTASPIVAVGAGRHECFDRLVFRVAERPAPGYTVRYVSQVVEDRSGELVPVTGGARLQITLNAPAHDEEYNPTVAPGPDGELFPAGTFTDWSTFRDVRWAGSFEARSSVVLDLRDRLPFRAFTLPGPSVGARVVVDVAHAW